MEVTIDKFGRILIPKKIREMLGLKPGTRVELVADTEKRNLAFQPIDAEEGPKLEVASSGLPIIQNGPPFPPNFDTVAFMKENLQEYLDKKMGLK
jgi:AbrB family looped-hinge helix DNA binding protein